MEQHLADLLTTTGSLAFATTVTLLISVLRTAFPPIASWNGAGLAFVLTLVFYVLAGVSTGATTLDAGFVVFLAWLGCAVEAVGIHKLAVSPIVDAVSKPTP